MDDGLKKVGRNNNNKGSRDHQNEAVTTSTVRYYGDWCDEH